MTMKPWQWAEYLAYGVKNRQFGEEEIEAKANFHPQMFPDGVNGDFLNAKSLDANELLSTFQSRFEIPENRDIAACAGEIASLVGVYGNLSLSSSPVVVDVGTGTGLFLRPLSSLVGPKGKVVGTEISDVFLSHLRRKISEEHLNNCSLVQSSASSLNLDPSLTVDVAFICDVYHHFEFPRTIIRDIRRSLNPSSGRLIVLDFIRDEDVHKSHPRGWISQHVRAGQAVFRNEITSCGFKLLAEPSIPALFENYIMVFCPVPLSTSVPGGGWT